MSLLFEELSALEALQEAGIPTSMYVGNSWKSVVELLKSSGYVQLSNGMWSSGELLTTSLSTSAGTALSTTTNVGAVEFLTGDAVLNADGSVAAYLGGTGAAASTVGESTAAVGAVTLTPKTAIIAGVAGACGLSLGYDTGQWIVGEFFGGKDFDWSKDSIGGKVITLLKGDGKTYIDEDLANRIKDRLIEIGAFEDSGYPEPEVKTYTPPYPLIDLMSGAERYISLKDITYAPALKRISTLLAYAQSNMPSGYSAVSYTFGNSDFSQYLDFRKDSDAPSSVIATKNGDSPVWLSSNEKDYEHCRIYIDQNDKIHTEYGRAHSSYFGGYYYNFNFGKPKGGIPGVNKQPNAIYPSSDPLSKTYPNWTSNGKKIFAGDDDDVNKKINMIPISIPADGESNKPQSDAQTGTNTDKSIKEQIDSQDDVSQKTNIDPSIKVPTNDTGDLPITPVPAVGIPGTGFVAIYNPTQSQLASFSQYLWSNDFIDNIKKLFEDPMQAIIGLHMIYATPSRGADHNIICGYLDSGVNSRTVSSQYINIACGAIKVNKYFGNILDYAPYTKIQLFLPFIGVVNLDTNEVMGSTLNVTYRVDVLTGACLAQVSVSRSDYGAVMYTFSGNCAVQLPITGGNYSSIIANTIGIGASIGATIASGGALAPVAVAGAAAGVSNSHLNVAHSGSIGANAGAMGGKIPYLIITRPKPYNANNYNNFYGYPSNKTIKLSSCTGYTRVKDIHLENISSATDDELNEIESLLKEGVII